MSGVLYIAEPKIDGLSFSARYEDGLYVQGLTRGDGEYGEDVTENLSRVQGWPAKLTGDFPRIFEPRGEVYITHANLKRLIAERAETGLSPFADARNAAAGSLRQKDPEVTARRRLDYAVWGWGEISDDCDMGDSYFAFKTRIAGWGLNVVPTIMKDGWFNHSTQIVDIISQMVSA